MRLTRRGEMVANIVEFLLILLVLSGFLALGAVIVALWFRGQA